MSFRDYLAALWLSWHGFTEQQIRSLMVADDDRLYPQAA